MADPSPSSENASPSSLTTRITDLNVDSLAQCASYLNLQDITNMAISCKALKQAAYSDSVWIRLFRERWPWSQEILSSSLQTLGIREAYLARHKALHQFKFVDPVHAPIDTSPKPIDHLLLDKNYLFFTQGPSVQMVKIDDYLSGRWFRVPRCEHNARITCMRLFGDDDISLFWGAKRKANVLITSSCDHSIRLWWKGCLQRCFKGHNGPVSTLSDKLLGDASGRLLASGGEDGTVRLWSLNSSGKRGQQALKATLYGHGKPVKLMTVAGHKTSLLLSIAKDSKVRVWDTSTSSAVRSSCCVGMTSVAGTPVDMKCHESLLYVAAGSSVNTIDLRTMQKVSTVAISQPQLYSAAILPSKSLICTGGDGKAMLWDTRRTQEALKSEPMVELDGHSGPVTLLHMDSDRVVAGGPGDYHVNIWDTDTGVQTNSLLCCSPEQSRGFSGCSALAVDGYRIVTAACGEEQGLLQYWDFTHATCPISNQEVERVSKFWGRSQDDSDTDSDDSDS